MSDKLKTLSCVAATGCFVFLFVLAPMSATADEKTVWKKYDNSIPAASDTSSTNGRVPLGISGGDTIGVFSATVIQDGYTYKMWYSGTDATAYCIYHATLDQTPKITVLKFR